MRRPIGHSGTRSLAEYRLAKIEAREVANVWAQVAPWLESALAHGDGDMNLGDVLIALASGQHQLWVVRSSGRIVAAATGVVLQYPCRRVYAVPLMRGSEMVDWLHFHAEIEAEARALGCSRMEGYARQGWARRAPPGWFPASTVIRKDLTE